MGEWNTLHIYDEREKSKAIDVLKNIDELKFYLNKYVEKYLNDKCFIDENIIIKTLKQDLYHFENLFELGTLLDNHKISRDLSHRQEYHYKLFIEYFIFQKYSNYYPYFKLGKRSFSASIDYLNRNTIAEEIINSLLYSWSSFTNDGDGIRKILLPKDLFLLESDLEKIRAKSFIDEQIVYEFKSFIKYLTKNNLGLISGVNLVERRLESQNLKPIDINLKNLVYKSEREEIKRKVIDKSIFESTNVQLEIPNFKNKISHDFNGTIDGKYLLDLMYFYQIASGQSFFKNRLLTFINYLEQNPITLIQNGADGIITSREELEKILKKIDKTFKMDDYLN